MALKKVAVEDINGVMTAEHFDTDRFPNMPIRVNRRWGQIQRKYVV